MDIERFKEGLANIDEMIALHREYIGHLQKLKLGLEQHYIKLYPNNSKELASCGKMKF